MNESQKQPEKIAEFINKFIDKEKIDVVLGISDGNIKQQKESLALFVELINTHAAKIRSVDIMVTAYIQRHYHGEKEALRRRDKWIEENQETLKLLSVPYKVTDWKDVIETNEFKEAQVKVKEVLEKDESFQKKIENMSRAHKQKANEEKAREYLLEEAAYFLNRKAHVCYPADNLNIACQHLIENYNNDVVFHGYRFKPRDFKNVKNKKEGGKSIYLPKTQTVSNQPMAAHPVTLPLASTPVLEPLPFSYSAPSCTPEEVLYATVSLARLMSKCGLHGRESKTAYFSQVLETTEKFLILQEHGNGKTDEEKSPQTPRRRSIHTG